MRRSSVRGAAHACRPATSGRPRRAARRAASTPGANTSSRDSPTLPRADSLVRAAALATALTDGLVWLLIPHRHYIYSLFYERSWIQYVTTFCFWVTMSVLAIKHFAFLHERKAYEAARLALDAPEFGSTLIWS